ncbi:hypothetical protein [Halobellus sp. H-GB7]|uniref:hypothetical protein n=1 Tax=Halobellus sp. H-GB7 TaxID=3069756 RepID=UPI0027B7560E|nr:hypothetical protein [Halobellus sp. H-GB7]MDQ2053236.1 hypothetical protein [Halobellus sp. H-GB7]
MTTLESGFEDKLHTALLDDAERRAREEIAPELKTKANDLLTRYGQRHDYDVGTLVDAARVEVGRTADAVTITLYYPHPALLFERGTADHEVTGDPLSFVWSKDDDPPEWVREQFEREGDGWRVFLQTVEVSGLPEAGFIRDALNAMRQNLQR